MADINRVEILGRLGADPEIKSFQNGGRLANLRIATSESWKDRTTGEKKERTEWHSVTIRSDGLIGIVERYLKKGSRVLVVGQLQTRKWQDQSGNDRYTTEIVVQGYKSELIMLDSPKSGGGGSTGGGNTGSGSGGGDWGSGSGGGQRSGGSGMAGGFADDLDDDIPF